MESLIDFVCSHASSAHWIIFLLLMLAGINVPISEDVLVLTAGIIASTCIPDQTLHLFVWVYMGCWMSAWEAYWLGRLLGPKLYQLPWFKHFITPDRIENLHHYYERFGLFTFMIGRFIPGGVRNALFMTSGLGKMPFNKFILRDGFACLLSTTTLFSIGYQFGEHYETLLFYFKKYNLIFGSLVFIFFTILAFYFWRRPRAQETSGK